MMILTIRTDKPEAEIGLYEDGTQLAYKTWLAHRELAETLHDTIHALLKDQSKDWEDIQGIACFKGPGSFTGLRIGLTVGNTLSYSLGVPIVSSESDDWIQQACMRLAKGEDEKLSMPYYGSEAHITLPKK